MHVAVTCLLADEVAKDGNSPNNCNDNVEIENCEQGIIHDLEVAEFRLTYSVSDQGKDLQL